MLNQPVFFMSKWLIHNSRICILPLLGTAGLSAPDSKCRRCKKGAETTSHVVSHCRNNLPVIGRRHDVLGATDQGNHKSGSRRYSQQGFSRYHPPAAHHYHYDHAPHYHRPDSLLGRAGNAPCAIQEERRQARVLGEIHRNSWCGSPVSCPRIGELSI